MEQKKPEQKVIVIGHKNPDTDSVCSAIAYAHLQNEIHGGGYSAARAGTLSNETDFVLTKFGLKNKSMLVLDVEPTVADMDERRVDPISQVTSLRNAWNTMRDNDVHTLPIVDGDSMLEGVITLQDIAVADMDSLDGCPLSEAPIPVANLIESLDAKLLVGEATTLLNRGKVAIGAGSTDVIEDVVAEGDVVIVANRLESQMSALEESASCLIICLADEIDKKVLDAAKERGCVVLSTDCTTYRAARLISQSVPVSHFMSRDVEAFTPGTTLEEVREVMSRVRYNHFPVIDKDGCYHGLVSKRNLISYKKKNLVLVDHNEKSQCVDGFEQANILGIIDHHRLGDIETTGPMFFRGMPVGCTATIIKGLYEEAGIEIPAEIAGIMCCAILSDTLAFRSPTCTAMDKAAAEELAKIAGENIENLAAEMFEAGENLDDRTPVSLFNIDCKVLRVSDKKIAIAQGTFYTENNRQKGIEMIKSCIEDELRIKGCDAAFYLATSIIDRSSDVIYAGEEAAQILGDAFHIGIDEDTVCLPGLVSRKKQFVPAVMGVVR